MTYCQQMFLITRNLQNTVILLIVTYMEIKDGVIVAIYRYFN